MIGPVCVDLHNILLAVVTHLGWWLDWRHDETNLLIHNIDPLQQLQLMLTVLWSLTGSSCHYWGIQSAPSSQRYWSLASRNFFTWLRLHVAAHSSLLMILKYVLNLKNWLLSWNGIWYEILFNAWLKYFHFLTKSNIFCHSRQKCFCLSRNTKIFIPSLLWHYPPM